MATESPAFLSCYNLLPAPTHLDSTISDYSDEMVTQITNSASLVQTKGKKEDHFLNTENCPLKIRNIKKIRLEQKGKASLLTTNSPKKEKVCVDREDHSECGEAVDAKR